MRQKLNSNPLAQVALIGVLLVAVGFVALSSMGGGGGESSSTSTTSASVSAPAAGSAPVAATTATPSSASTSGTPSASAPVSGTPEVPAPPLPHKVSAAFAANRTVVLLIIKRGGIDDAVTKARIASALPPTDAGVSLSIVPADRIARYTAITQGLKVEQVPALIVVRPKRLDKGIPTASVSYGVQTVQSVVQAIRDARYKGRTLNYYP
jgi:hypothetical protein